MITLPTGEVIKPHPNFTVVATMNAEPHELTEALRDRFPVQIHITTVNPHALATLPSDLRSAAAGTAAVWETERRKSIRTWKAFDELRSNLPGGDAEIVALEACFGKMAYEIQDTLRYNKAHELEEARRYS